MRDWGYDAAREAGADSVLRLGLSPRTQSALVRSGYLTVSEVIDAADRTHHPAIRGLGEKGWEEIEQALARPLGPVPSD